MAAKPSIFTNPVHNKSIYFRLFKCDHKASSNQPRIMHEPSPSRIIVGFSVLRVLLTLPECRKKAVT